MTVLEIYEKVNLKIPLEQRRFFDYYNDTVEELNSLYSDFVTEHGTAFSPIGSIYDPYTVLPRYASAIVDNILYLSGYDKDGTCKAEFLRKAENAHLSYWKENAKNKRIKRMRW